MKGYLVFFPLRLGKIRLTFLSQIRISLALDICSVRWPTAHELWITLGGTIIAKTGEVLGKLEQVAYLWTTIYPDAFLSTIFALFTG